MVDKELEDYQKKANELYQTGVLQPEFLAVHMWIKKMVRDYDGKANLVFDGTPRKLHEAGVLDSIFDFYGINKPNVLHIDINSGEALKRLILRKRLDDHEDDIKKRLAWFETEVQPTIDWYGTNNRYTFHKIDGMGTVEDIHKDVVNKLGLR